jgi:putative copper export protein/methionine-rich copper-binding protein CopC
MRKVTSLIAALCVLFLAFPENAGAHASVVDASPAPGSTLTALPSTFSITFDAEVDAYTVSAKIISGTPIAPGADISDLDRVTQNFGSVIEFSLPAAATPPVSGEVMLSWRAFSLDGHNMGGYIPYVLSAAAATTTSTTTPTPSATPSPANAAPTSLAVSTTREISSEKGSDWSLLKTLSRYLAVLLASFLFGAWFWSKQKVHKLLDRLISVQWLSLSSTASRILAVVSGVTAIIPLLNYASSGAADAQGYAAILTSSSVFMWALVAVCAWYASTQTSTVLVPVVLTVLATAMSAHAANTFWMPVSVLFSAAHVTAVLLWVGPLLALGALRFVFPPAKLPGFVMVYKEALLSFSSLATKAIAVLLISGTRQAIAISDGVPSGQWGKLLFAKVILFLIIVAPLGAYHNRTLKRAGTGESDPPALTTYLYVELGAILLVMLLAARLAQTPI